MSTGGATPAERSRCTAIAVCVCASFEQKRLLNIYLGTHGAKGGINRTYAQQLYCVGSHNAAKSHPEPMRKRSANLQVGAPRTIQTRRHRQQERRVLPSVLSKALYKQDGCSRSIHTFGLHREHSRLKDVSRRTSILRPRRGENKRVYCKPRVIRPESRCYYLLPAHVEGTVFFFSSTNKRQRQSRECKNPPKQVSRP